MERGYLGLSQYNHGISLCFDYSYFHVFLPRQSVADEVHAVSFLLGRMKYMHKENSASEKGLMTSVIYSCYAVVIET